jgi:hypothetical protein
MVYIFVKIFPAVNAKSKQTDNVMCQIFVNRNCLSVMYNWSMKRNTVISASATSICQLLAGNLRNFSEASKADKEHWIAPDIIWELGLSHRWARLLNQQSLITVYCLLTKENKLPFSIFLCSKLTEVCRFCFP